MKLRRVLSKRIDHEGEGLSVRAAIDAVVAVNVNEPQGVTTASSQPPARDEKPKEATDE
jgi:hypothetical protein